MSAPLAYDAVMVLADAIKRAGTLNRTRLREALAETTGFKGATVIISFDETGDPRDKEVIILKLERGFAMYHKTISP